MAEVKKADIIYMQNELLSDINSLEKKLSDKITQLSIVIQNQKLISEQNFELSKGNYKILLEKIESNENLDKIKQQFTEFKTKINNNLIVNNSKISSLERELKDIGFKYDNLFNNNISTPGLIGKGGKYKDLRNFREYLDKKINELIIYKEKNIIDIKKYKEKMDNIIGQIQLRTQNNESKYFEFCYEKINEAKKEIMDKFSLLDESINNIKIENGKYSFDLIKKSEDLQNQINTFKNIEQDINTKLNEQSEKYKKELSDSGRQEEPKMVINTNSKPVFRPVSTPSNSASQRPARPFTKSVANAEQKPNLRYQPTPQADFRRQNISPNAAEGKERMGLKDLAKLIAEDKENTETTTCK